MTSTIDPRSQGMAPISVGEIIPAFQSVARLTDEASNFRRNIEQTDQTVKSILIEGFGAFTPGLDPSVGLDKFDEETREQLRTSAVNLAVYSYLAEQTTSQRDIASKAVSERIATHLTGQLVIIEALDPEIAPIDVIISGPVDIASQPGPRRRVRANIKHANPTSADLTLNPIENDIGYSKPVSLYVAHILGKNRQPQVSITLA